MAGQIVSELNQLRATNLSLAAGYATLYQGSSATGASPGVAVTNTTVFNGNLSAVEGAGLQPAIGTAAAAGPTFPSPHDIQIQAHLFNFRARTTGRVAFMTRASQVAHRLGRSNSIRADQGQPNTAVHPISIGSIKQTGFGVTISAPLSGTGQPFAIGQNFQAGTGAVILGGPGKIIGDNVSIGAARSWTGVPSAAARPWELERTCSTRRSRREATFKREQFGLTVSSLGSSRSNRNGERRAGRGAGLAQASHCIVDPKRWTTRATCIC